ncbi:succinylglutamate desuccinylase/aspartoacylase family protein [Streptomyces phaeofaciens]|uniref:succinylglutamate desuccinylase/aspartoacylase family protein n=1 Tax=Streptomyces phaeofaciens TaxID=68254 RepID=UPI00367BCDFC
MIVREIVKPPSHVLRDLEIPLVTARGHRPGPTLTLLAGIHGCEYAPMAALRGWMRKLDTDRLSGTVRAVLLANPTAFRARTPFVTPEDGRNLNRCFPGDAHGSHSEQLADFLYREFFRGSDALVDLHAGDLVEALTPFTLYEESPVAEESRELAVAYGLPFAIRQARAGATVTGSAFGAATRAAIPAIIAEAGGCGLVTAEAVRAHTTGLTRVLHHLDMLPSGPSEAPSAPAEVRHMTRFTWLHTPATGWWEPAAGPGREVRTGAHLGSVLDPFGDELRMITAPEDGVVVFQTSSPAVEADGLLLALAGGEIRPDRTGRRGPGARVSSKPGNPSHRPPARTPAPGSRSRIRHR